MSFALLAVVLTVLIAVNQSEPVETPPASRGGGNDSGVTSRLDTTREDAGKSTGVERLENDGGSIVMKRTSAPEKTELRLPEGDNVQSFSVSEYSITGEAGVSWSRERERIDGVQESPDGTTVLFYNCSTARYEVYRNENGKLLKLDMELPHRDQTTRVNGWYWIANDKLIGEHNVLLEPVPQGFGDEGWTKDIKFYIYDLKTNKHQKVSFPGVPECEQGVKQILKDEFIPAYSYELPITRYYSINGITDEGVICLMSFDTSQPRGGNSRDEGWFKLEEE